MDGNYLIPANSKKSMLILGFFNVVDLIIFGTGIFITFLFLILPIPKETIKELVFVITPALIGAFLVLPVPNHHNIRTFIKNVYMYFSNRRTYFWRGWCINRGKK